MTNKQIHNLVELCCLMSTNDQVMNQSPDYLREKFDHYLGIEPIILVITETSLNWNETYQKRWQPTDKLHSNFFKLKVDIHTQQPDGTWARSENFGQSHWMNLRPLDLVSLVSECFGDLTNMTTERYSNMHQLLRTKLFDPYTEKHSRFFKLNRILENELVTGV